MKNHLGKSAEEERYLKDVNVGRSGRDGKER